MHHHDTLSEMLALLRNITVVTSVREENDLVASLLARDQSTVVSFFNQHAFNLAFAQPAFRTALTRSTVLLRDGVGVECCMAILGYRSGRNLNGTDLIPKILSAGTNKRIALFGTSQEWLAIAKHRLTEQGVRVVAAIDGFRPISEYLDAVEATDPDIAILGMGMPRQEYLAIEITRLRRRPILVLNGGAILDFYAQRFPRAPAVVRAARLEWMYRLLQEPRRLGKRYLYGGILFAWRMYQLLRHPSATADKSR